MKIRIVFTLIIDCLITTTLSLTENIRQHISKASYKNSKLEINCTLTSLSPVIVYLNLYVWTICSCYEYASERKFGGYVLIMTLPVNANLSDSL